MKKRLLSLAMVACLVLTLVPAVAFAAKVENCPGSCTHVAAVGTTHYDGIQDAIKDAAPAGTVDLLSDVTVDEWIMFSESLSIGSGQIITLVIDGLTINGNGYELTVNSVESAGNGNCLFDDATKLNINNMTINLPNGAGNGIGLTSGEIKNVTFNGGGYGVFPGNGDITITGCTFNTNSHAIYYETARDNLVVDDNTFNTADGKYAIYLRGNETFTNNTVIKGRVNVTNSATGEVSGNDFGTERFKVYNGATAKISNNKIDNIVFNDNTAPKADFTGNTLSDAAEDALESVGAENKPAPAPAPNPAPAKPSAIDKFEKQVDNDTDLYINSVSMGGGTVKFTLSGNGATVLADGAVVYPDANGAYTVASNAKVTITYASFSVEVPKTGDMPFWAAVLALLGF